MRFNLDANEAHSPETARRRSARQGESYSDGESSKRRHRRRKKHDSKDSGGLMHDKYERPPSGTTNDEGEDSDGTVEMPARFDKHGNKIVETPDTLQTLLGTLASRFLGGDDDAGERDSRDGRSGRRRHRH